MARRIPLKNPKPCPFCSHDNSDDHNFINAEPRGTEVAYWIVKCSYCGAMQQHRLKGEAIKAWNTRGNYKV
jgi:uncharacterized Zn finger protein